ncbi:MAG: sulfurtransferase TusA family protein [Candidatus Saccharibacteria bacterium]|nr:sulfurtransferase TusA family protein [Pseudorhodobacter sp.]
MNDDRELDCENMLCPLPVLKARKVLLTMRPGQTLRIRTTDKMALIDLPHFCGEAGHDYLEAREDGPVVVHLIRRG